MHGVCVLRKNVWGFIHGAGNRLSRISGVSCESTSSAGLCRGCWRDASGQRTRPVAGAGAAPQWERPTGQECFESGRGAGYRSQT